MIFLTKKHLSRRTFLRGAGAAIALPLLDAMVPARALARQSAALTTTRSPSLVDARYSFSTA